MPKCLSWVCPCHQSKDIYPRCPKCNRFVGTVNGACEYCHQQAGEGWVVEFYALAREHANASYLVSEESHPEAVENIALENLLVFFRAQIAAVREEFACTKHSEKSFETGRAAMKAEILAALPNEDEIREWQSELAPEAALDWFASGAIRMRLKIRKLLSQ